jgi:hypothetical protein
VLRNNCPQFGIRIDSNKTLGQWFFSSDFAQRSGNSKKRRAQARLDRITHLMYTKQFEKALTEIQEATARTDSKSIAQDLEECLVKCQLALGNFPEALNTSQRLVRNIVGPF